MNSPFGLPTNPEEWDSSPFCWWVIVPRIPSPPKTAANFCDKNMRKDTSTIVTPPDTNRKFATEI